MLSYSRVLLKLSGEFFAGDQASSASSLTDFSLSTVNSLVQELSELQQQSLQVAIVIGAGNLVRGDELAKQGFDPIVGDYMGMFGTLINGLMLKQSCVAAGIDTCLMSLLSAPDVIADYDVSAAIAALDKQQLVIFAGGTGKPCCTTDSAASQRAVDIQADIILKATKVDGIYSADPKQDSDVEFYSKLSYDQVIAKRLAVMDLQAFEYCRDHQMPIRVFNMYQPQALKRLLHGEEIGSLVT